MENVIYARRTGMGNRYEYHKMIMFDSNDVEIITRHCDKYVDVKTMKKLMKKREIIVNTFNVNEFPHKLYGDFGGYRFCKEKENVDIIMYDSMLFPEERYVYIKDRKEFEDYIDSNEGCSITNRDEFGDEYKYLIFQRAYNPDDHIFDNAIQNRLRLHETDSIGVNILNLINSNKNAMLMKVDEFCKYMSETLPNKSALNNLDDAFVKEEMRENLIVKLQIYLNCNWNVKDNSHMIRFYLFSNSYDVAEYADKSTYVGLMLFLKYNRIRPLMLRKIDAGYAYNIYEYDEYWRTICYYFNNHEDTSKRKSLMKHLWENNHAAFIKSMIGEFSKFTDFIIKDYFSK